MHNFLCKSAVEILNLKLVALRDKNCSFKIKMEKKSAMKHLMIYSSGINRQTAGKIIGI